MTDLASLQETVRTYLILSQVLRDQGLVAAANHMRYRGMIKGRAVLVREQAVFSYVGSWILDLICGYGYRPLRSFITYVLVAGAFAVSYALLAYFGLTAEHFPSSGLTYRAERHFVSWTRLLRRKIATKRLGRTSRRS